MNKNKKIWIGLGTLTGLAVVISSITIPLVVSHNKSNSNGKKNMIDQDSDEKKNIADQEKEQEKNQNIADAVTTKMIESAIKAINTWDDSTEVISYTSLFQQIELQKGDINGSPTAMAVVSLSNPNFINGTIDFSATVTVGKSGNKTITGKLTGFQTTPRTIDDLPPLVKKFYLDAGYTKGSNTIKDELFNGRSLPDGFKIPASITSIGKSAFAHEILPAGFTIPPSVTSIESSAFISARIPAGFTIPSSVTSIDVGVFSNAILPAGFKIPSSVTSIGAYAFFNTTLPAGFTIPSSVTSIDVGAFSYAIIPAGFKISSSLTYIGSRVFFHATIPVGFTIPSSVISIESDAFSGVTIPDGYNWSNGAPTAGSSIVKN